MGSKRPFELFLNPFWEVSDLFWTLSGAFGRVFWLSNLNFYKALVQHGLQVAFWIDFDRVWRRFGCVLVAVRLSQLKLLHHVVIS